MHSRHLIGLVTLAFAASFAQAVELKPYSAAAVQEAQQAGKPHAIHFHADWCPTCRAQQKVLQSLKDDKDLNLPVYVADYDKEKELKKTLNVRSQSVLLVYRGKQEKARLAGDTDSNAIRNALKQAF